MKILAPLGHVKPRNKAYQSRSGSGPLSTSVNRAIRSAPRYMTNASLACHCASIPTAGAGPRCADILATDDAQASTPTRTACQSLRTSAQELWDPYSGCCLTVRRIAGAAAISRQEGRSLSDEPQSMSASHRHHYLPLLGPWTDEAGQLFAYRWIDARSAVWAKPISPRSVDFPTASALSLSNHSLGQDALETRFFQRDPNDWRQRSAAE